MHDANDFLNIVKKAALDAVNADKPSDFCFGKFTSVKPLKIQVEQKMTLGAAQLVLTRNVTTHNVKVTLEGSTEKTEMTIHNELAVGDEVILLKRKGGQKYLVLDRVVKA